MKREFLALFEQALVQDDNHSSHTLLPVPISAPVPQHCIVQPARAAACEGDEVSQGHRCCSDLSYDTKPSCLLSDLYKPASFSKLIWRQACQQYQPRMGKGGEEPLYMRAHKSLRVS